MVAQPSAVVFYHTCAMHAASRERNKRSREAINGADAVRLIRRIGDPRMWGHVPLNPHWEILRMPAAEYARAREAAVGARASL